jgi:hypothetical protein
MTRNAQPAAAHDIGMGGPFLRLCSSHRLGITGDSSLRDIAIKVAAAAVAEDDT